MKAILEHLRPYKSLILAEVSNPKQPLNGLVVELLDDLQTALKLDGTDQMLDLVERQAPAQIDQNTEVGFLQFTQSQTPAWTGQADITDKINQLVLVLRHGTSVAIYCSDPGLRPAVMSRIDDDNALGLAKLQRIKRARLNAAFVQGKTRTLWLSGVHRRTSIKADSKILSGADLQDALNPLDDQTYNFTAVRCAADVGTKTVTMGSVPRQSRVWFGRSKSWVDFCDSTIAILKHLQQVKKDQDAPLPILARPVANAAGVKAAFDFSFQTPELLGDNNLTDRELKALEQLAYDANTRVSSINGADFEAELSVEGVIAGTLTIKTDLANPERVTLAATCTVANDKYKDLMGHAVRFAHRPSCVSVRYDSGHTISDGMVVELRHRDIPFHAFEWVDFGNFNVDQEKPTPVGSTGKGKSLFCWVQQNWPLGGKGGWLACDDGAGELADFVHIDHTLTVPMVSLIHVKGSGSKTANRGISVSEYEVVTGQAVKNLRHVDRDLLAEGLAKGVGKKIGKLVWHDRKPSTRAKFLTLLKQIGANHRRQVIIIQPRVTKVCHDAARARPTSVDAIRLRQLDTLLISAEMSCRALNAEFKVLTAM